MKSNRYLNTVLTLIALLLTLNLYAGWATTPAGALTSPVGIAEAQGVSNAGTQRAQMIDLLKALNVKLDAVSTKLSDGSMRARVEAPRGSE